MHRLAHRLVRVVVGIVRVGLVLGAGAGTTVLFWLLTQAFVYEFFSGFQRPYVFIPWLNLWDSLGLFLLSFFAGGFVAGILGGRNGWLWGLLASLATALYSVFGLVLWSLFQWAYSGIAGNLVVAAVLLVFCLEAGTIGGWLGERLWRRIRRRTTLPTVE